MNATLKLLGVAVAAGVLGVAASVWLNGPGPLLRTEWGQRAAQTMTAASAPGLPPGVNVAERGQIVSTFALSPLTAGAPPISVPAAYKGRPVLINVWASWCGPCVREMPELDRYARQQGTNGTQVVGIALDDRDGAQRFLQRHPVRYPILIDTPGPADAGVRLGNPRGLLPYSVLLDPQGRVLRQRFGPFQAGEIESWTTLE